MFRNLLSRVLTQGRGSDEELGPHTTVDLLGWFGVFGRRCSCTSFVPLVAVLVLLADAVLATFAGLDMVNRGTRSPYVQFVLSLSLATLYLVLLIVTVVQYMYERVLRYRFHWLWMMALAALLAWTNFGIWASWLANFPSEADGVRGSDGTPFVAWVGANAAGLAGFFARVLVFAAGQGLRYTFERSLEIQGLLLASTTGGKSLVEGLEQPAGYGGGAAVEGGVPPHHRYPYYQHPGGVMGGEEDGGEFDPELAQYPLPPPHPQALPMYAGTNFQSSQQVRRQRPGARRHSGAVRGPPRGRSLRGYR